MSRQYLRYSNQALVSWLRCRCWPCWCVRAHHVFVRLPKCLVMFHTLFAAGIMTGLLLLRSFCCCSALLPFSLTSSCCHHVILAMFLLIYGEVRTRYLPVAIYLGSEDWVAEPPSTLTNESLTTMTNHDNKE